MDASNRHSVSSPEFCFSLGSCASLCRFLIDFYLVLMKLRLREDGESRDRRLPACACVRACVCVCVLIFFRKRFPHLAFQVLSNCTARRYTTRNFPMSSLSKSLQRFGKDWRRLFPRRVLARGGKEKQKEAAREEKKNQKKNHRETKCVLFFSSVFFFFFFF